MYLKCIDGIYDGMSNFYYQIFTLRIKMKIYAVILLFVMESRQFDICLLGTFFRGNLFSIHPR